MLGTIWISAGATKKGLIMKRRGVISDIIERTKKCKLISQSCQR